MRVVTGIAVCALVALAACGKGAPKGSLSTMSQIRSTGPIASACLRSGQRAASGPLCGCVQAAANLSLTPSEQKRGAAWFTNPHEAQEVRQSDRRGDERMWQRWKAFVDTAEAMCR